MLRDALDTFDDTRARRLAASFLVSFTVLTLVMVGLGLLITKALSHDWPFSAEDGLDRWFAGRRDAFGDDTSDLLSTVANTIGAGAITLAAIVVARVRAHRWREPLFLAYAVALELSVFLATTFVVRRNRPAVSHLDISPPTSSFPSGHTAAAVALYGAVALLLVRATRCRAWWLLLLMPAAVGVARVYRGMHHPTDVLGGALLGALCVLCARHVVLRAEPDWSASSAKAVSAKAGSAKAASAKAASGSRSAYVERRAA